MSTTLQTPAVSGPAVPDPIAEGLRRGWKVHGGPRAPLPASLSCDVAIVGTGAGAGITAELLTAAGLDVLLIEEGPLRSSSQFRQLESDAYPQLYQESASRQTADKAINIMQGRCVGGSTTVNWTSSFRTPKATLAWWQQRYELPGLGEADMAPWFLQAEQRLHIGPWPVPPNLNNDLLRQGAAKLGIPTAAIQRNVRGCWNLGSCGMGCPTNAKQSMLVTTLPVALNRGARLLVQTRAQRIEFDKGRAVALLAVPVSLQGDASGAPLRITFKHLVVAGGAINSPGLLMRSQATDPHRRLGTRTFLHPVVLSAAVFDQTVAGWDGAPQTIFSDHFLETQPLDGPIGYKLEAPPLHPVIASSTLPGFGEQQAQAMAAFPRTQALVALMRDGFHEQSQGGTVQLKGERPVLDYPLNDYILDGARRALLSMAEIQFAAGARQVTPGHEAGRAYTSWAQAREAIAALPMVKYQTRVVSAHVMGGCGMAGKPELGVVRPDGTHWQLENLSVHDGSLFPTSIGANPQLSIYGMVTRLATGLAKRLNGRDVQLGA